MTQGGGGEGGGSANRFLGLNRFSFSALHALNLNFKSKFLSSWDKQVKRHTVQRAYWSTDILFNRPTRQTKWHQINIKLTSFLECLTSVWHNKKTSNWRQNEPLLTSIWCHFVMSKWRQISLNYVNLMFVWCQFDVCLMSFRRRN